MSLWLVVAKSRDFDVKGNGFGGGESSREYIRFLANVSRDALPYIF
jgi:hypothetical protein